MSAVLLFGGVRGRGGGATLLAAIDWSVREDERWVVLGPNGAGKTTLMQVASAQIHPTAGVAGILDEVLGTVDVFELRPRIGLTSAALAERIPRDERVRDVVVSASYGVVGRWREAYDELDHERAHELLVEVGVERLADRTFGTLSEGERKRVQIARALMADPELLLLDEPAAGSSSSSSSGSLISARATCTRLRSPSLRVPKVRSARWLTPTSTSRSAARPWSSSSYASRQRPTTP
jgi:iron complex transport system ATP-binding protein